VHDPRSRCTAFHACGQSSAGSQSESFNLDNFIAYLMKNVSRYMLFALVIAGGLALLSVSVFRARPPKPVDTPPVAGRDQQTSALRQSITIDKKPALSNHLDASPVAFETSLPEPAIPRQAGAPTSTTVTNDPEARVLELEATERMIEAHAELRSRAVADPDSEQNRRILQTMIGKAVINARLKSGAPKER